MAISEVIRRKVDGVSRTDGRARERSRGLWVNGLGPWVVKALADANQPTLRVESVASLCFEHEARKPGDKQYEIG